MVEGTGRIQSPLAPVAIPRYDRPMARADRLERLERQRIDAEADYQALLLAALNRCAGGVWGLFEHNWKDRAQRANFAEDVEALTGLAAGINAMRKALFIEPFTLHDEFLAARGPVSSSAVGEPKQAKAWLERLKAQGIG